MNSSIIISIIAGLIAIVFIGFFYLRMIKREVPEPIGKVQALLPAVLGGICFPISGASGIGLLFALNKIGISSDTMPSFPGAFYTAFFMAGGVEEVFKYLAIIITLCILRKKVKNVYEIILIGAAVGFGFTVAEDLSYGNSLAVLFTRLPFMLTHMILNMIMGEFIGMAKYNKINGNGATALYWALALIIPTALHTLFDAGTVSNYPIFRDGNYIGGGILAGTGIVINFALMFYMLIRTKKIAEKLSGLSVIPVDVK